MSQPYRCKGAPGQPCVETVTYTWMPVYSIVNTKVVPKNAAGQDETVYLTCSLKHTNPYLINSQGEIIG
jgi:hypothetical protein